MRRYVEFADALSARARSMELWETKIGRKPLPSETTKMMFGIIEHPDRGRQGNRAAMEVPDQREYTDRLNENERTRSRNEGDMIADGWIADTEE